MNTITTTTALHGSVAANACADVVACAATRASSLCAAPKTRTCTCGTPRRPRPTGPQTSTRCATPPARTAPSSSNAFQVSICIFAPPPTANIYVHAPAAREMCCDFPCAKYAVAKGHALYSLSHPCSVWWGGVVFDFRAQGHADSVKDRGRQRAGGSGHQRQHSLLCEQAGAAHALMRAAWAPPYNHQWILHTQCGNLFSLLISVCLYKSNSP